MKCPNITTTITSKRIQLFENKQSYRQNETHSIETHDVNDITQVGGQLLQVKQSEWKKK